MAVFRLTTTDRSLREAVAVDAPSSDVIVDPGVRPTVRLLGFTGAGRAVQYTTSPEAMICLFQYMSMQVETGKLTVLKLMC